MPTLLSQAEMVRRIEAVRAALPPTHDCLSCGRPLAVRVTLEEARL